MFKYFKRPSVAFSIGLIFSLLFLWLSARSTDLDSIRKAFETADLSWTIASLLAFTAFCVMKAMRWSSLLNQDEHATAAVLLSPILVGYMVTALLPMQVGELVRAYSASRRINRPFTVLLSTIVVERILDVVSIIAVISTVLLLGVQPGGIVWNSAIWLAAFFAGFSVLLAMAAQYPNKVHALVNSISYRASVAVRQIIVSKTDSFLLGLSALKSVRSIFAILGLSILMWLFMWLCVWISLSAFDIDVSPVASLIVLIALVIGMMLPAGPGHVGTFQLAFTLSLSTYGVSASDAFAASVYYQFMIHAPVIIAGLVALRASTRTLNIAASINETMRAAEPRSVD